MRKRGLGFGFNAIAAFCWVAGFSVDLNAAPLAILVNGGGKAIGNRCDFYSDLERGKTSTPAWDHVVFAADGGSGSGTNSEACDSKGESIKDADHRTVLARKMPSDAEPSAATFANIRKTLLERLKTLKEGDPVLLYFTDHGGNPDVTSVPPKEHTVGLWGETMSLTQLRGLLAEIPLGRKVVIVNDHCFGGGMLDAIWGKDGAPRPNTCGFSPANRAEFAFDGQSFMGMAAKMSKQQDKTAQRAFDRTGNGSYSFGEVHRYMMRSYSTSSTPVSSTDLFLERYQLALDQEKKGTRNGSKAAILNHCIFSVSGIDQLTRSLGPSYKVILQERIRALKDELAGHYAGAGVPEDTSYEKVGEILATRERAVAAAEKAEKDSFEDYAASVRAWITAKMGADHYQHLRDLTQQLDTIKEKLDSAPPSERPALEAEKMKLAQERTPLVEQAWGWQSAAKESNPAFKKFVTDGGGPPDNKWPKNALERHEKARMNWTNSNTGLQPVRRLANTLRSANALRNMVDSNDSEAMKQYLNMLDCENTDMGPIPKS